MFRRVSLIIAVSVVSLTSAIAFGAPNASMPMAAFSVSGSNSPQTSKWTGSAWGTHATLSSVGGEDLWIVLRSCPVTRSEMLFAGLDATMNLKVMISSGGTFGSPTTVGTSVSTSNQRAFDAGYEQVSAKALIAYWDHTNRQVGYRTWNGTTLSAQSLLALPTTDDLNFITLYPKAGTNNIMMIMLDGKQMLYSCNWNGTSWGTVATMCSDTQKDKESYAFAYGSLSGTGLLVYDRGTTTPKYRTWNGTTWSSESNMPAQSDQVLWFHLSADPLSNNILVGIQTKDNTLAANKWNGSSWGSNTTVEASVAIDQVRGFDIAYEANTGNGLIVYAEAAQSRWRYRTWNGAAWSAQQAGPSVPAVPRFIQLLRGGGNSEIFVAGSDASRNLAIGRWDGSTLSSPTTVQSTLGGIISTTESFMLAPSSDKMKIVKWREVPNP